VAGTINGKRYAYVHIKVTFPFGLVSLLDSIEYDDEEAGEVVTDMRGMPAGYVPGEYSGSCKVEMAFSEAQKFETAAIAAGGFYNLPPIPVAITYGDLSSGQALINEVLEVKWTKRGKGNSKGDKILKRSFEGVLTKPIVSNGVPALKRF